jgi:hypothetical protein
MLGDIPTMNEYTNGKDEYTMYIPLKFWFCNNVGLALPLVSLRYSEVKINLQLHDASYCYNISPTNYIQLDTDIVNFKPFEYIQQNVDGQIATGMFSYFDIINKYLYYTQISTNTFQSVASSNTQLSYPQQRTLLYSSSNYKYSITGLTSGFSAMPSLNSEPLTYSFNKSQISKLTLGNCYLLVDYIFLSEEERLQFAKAKHEYIIECVDSISQTTIQNTHRVIPTNTTHLTKLAVWITQLSYLDNNNDHFNYTDSFIYENGQLTGKSLIQTETMLFNGNNRISSRSSIYFNDVHPYEYFKYSPSEGINIYSFSLMPDKPQPSGSCNMDQINSVSIQLSLSHDVTIFNTANFRAYFLSQKFLRIIDGLAGLVFI